MSVSNGKFPNSYFGVSVLNVLVEDQVAWELWCFYLPLMAYAEKKNHISY